MENPGDRIIVALDKVTPRTDTLKLVEKLVKQGVHCFEIGLESAFIAGPSIIEGIMDLGGAVFCDSKIHDTPSRARKIAESLSGLNVAMFSVHASMGKNGMIAAQEGNNAGFHQRLNLKNLNIYPKSKIIAVTVLTSLSDNDSYLIYGNSSQDTVLKLVRLCEEAGLDGIICSGEELRIINRDPSLQRLTRIVAGIRPVWADPGDQIRSITPGEAIKQKATFLQIGRPITESNDIIQAVELIKDEIAEALSNTDN